MRWSRLLKCDRNRASTSRLPSHASHFSLRRNLENMRKDSGYPLKTAYDTERIWLSAQFGVTYGNRLPIHLIWDGYTENFRLITS